MSRKEFYNFYDLKPNLNYSTAFYEEENAIIFVQPSQGRKKVYEKDENLIKFILAMDGKTTSYELWRDLFEGTEINYEEIESALEFLYNDNVVTFNSSFDPKSIDYRWDRQIKFFKDNGLNGDATQIKLERSTATIVGVGGTGSWVAQALVMANIGEIYLIDNDKVSLSNLNRQVLYHEEDLNEKKVEVLKRRLTGLNEEVVIHAVDKMITTKEDINYFTGKSDIVISCADYPDIEEVGKIVSDSCYERNIPHIVGGGYSHNRGLLGLSVIPGKTACFNCYLKALEAKIDPSIQSNKLLKENREVLGSIGAIAGIIGNFISLDAIKILTDLSEPFMTNKRVEFDYFKGVITSNFSSKYDCERCKEHEALGV